jgi:hypothetical protein
MLRRHEASEKRKDEPQRESAVSQLRSRGGSIGSSLAGQAPLRHRPSIARPAA